MAPAERQREYSAQQPPSQLPPPYHHQSSGTGATGRASAMNPMLNAAGQMPPYYSEPAGYGRQQQQDPRRDQAAGEQRNDTGAADGS